MSHERIVITDPDAELAENLAARLKSRSFSVETVGSGQEALAALLMEVPQVMLLDMRLPDMEGLEALERLKDQAPSMAVICLIGRGATVSGMDAMERGAFDFLYKPLDLGLLLNKIAGALAVKDSS